MNAPAPAAAAPTVRGTDGRRLGRIARSTRENLLLALAFQLETVPWRALTVRKVASWADASPATFYQYFSSLEDAVLELADARRAAGRRVTGHLARVVKLLDYERNMAGRP